jgi:3-oxoacyl-[acyl-carrier protein] reductase
MSEPNNRFSGKVAVVTGGSRGIGKAIVSEFAAQGATVYFTYHRHEEAAEETANAFGAHKILCPQSNAGLIDATARDISAREGRIDILVNNAGITDDQYLMLMPHESWLKVLDTNVNGAFRWSKAVCGAMISARKGAIVNIASIAGMVGIAGQTNYAASKGALLALTRAMAAELGPKGIRVNAVAPGFIATDMTARMPRQIKQENQQRILLKRFGTPEEVARAVAFIASDDASYIVGQTIVIDGGLSAAVA